MKKIVILGYVLLMALSVALFARFDHPFGDILELLTWVGGIPVLVLLIIFWDSSRVRILYKYAWTYFWNTVLVSVYFIFHFLLAAIDWYLAQSSSLDPKDGPPVAGIVIGILAVAFVTPIVFLLALMINYLYVSLLLLIHFMWVRFALPNLKAQSN